MTGVLVFFHRRLGSKLIAVAPLIVGGVLLGGLLSVLLLAVEPFLPAPYRELLVLARRGEMGATQTALRALIASYGSWSVGLFLVVQFMQVLVAPIPGQLLGLIGGTLFGFWPSLLYSTSALAVGSLVAMGSTRLLGEQVLRRFVPASILKQFDRLVNTNGLWGFFLIFLLPIFPDDAICFMAGLTRIPLYRLMAVCVLGRLPGIALLSFAGAAGASGASTVTYVVLGVTMVLAFFLWLFSDELEAFLSRVVSGKRTRDNGGTHSALNHR